MKKWLLILLFLFMISGCTPDFKMNEQDVIEFQIDNINLKKEDYTKLLTYINKLHLSKRDVSIKSINNVKITTEDNVYILKVGSNTLSVQINKNIYYSKNKKTVAKLQKEIDTIIQKYNQKNFYTIKHETTEQPPSTPNLIKIDNVNEYFIITPSIPLKQVQIHKVEQVNGAYQDIDSIYQLENINTKSPIVIRMNPMKDYYRYRIKLTNIYGLTVSIIPTYDLEKETGKLTYITNYERA